jgi:hypothetical protein
MGNGNEMRKLLTRGEKILGRERGKNRGGKKEGRVSGKKKNGG